MSKIVVKTGKRKTSVSREAIKKAVNEVYNKNNNVKPTTKPAKSIGK